MNSDTVFHEFPPVFDENSEILILGSIPSPKSRKNGFYYMHPQNRFWKVVSTVMGEELPLEIPDKKAFLIRNHIALWDVLGSCEICGADDSSIRNPVPNDFSVIFNKASIKAVFTTGNKAAALYEKLCAERYAVQHIALPSTSPANCRMSFETLCESYKVMRGFMERYGSSMS